MVAEYGMRNDDRKLVVQTVLPGSLKRLFAFGALVVAIASQMVIATAGIGQYVGLVALMGGSMGFVYLTNASYRVAWTEAEISVSNGNIIQLLLPKTRIWRSVHFASISHVHAIAGRGLPPINALVPFGIVEIAGEGPQAQSVRLYPRVLNEIDLRDLLAHIEEVRPGALPKEIVARL